MNSKKLIQVLFTINGLMTSLITYITFLFVDLGDVEQSDTLLSMTLTQWLLIVIIGLGGTLFTYIIKKMVENINKDISYRERKKLLKRVRNAEASLLELRQYDTRIETLESFSFGEVKSDYIKTISQIVDLQYEYIKTVVQFKTNELKSYVSELKQFTYNISSEETRDKLDRLVCDLDYKNVEFDTLYRKAKSKLERLELHKNHKIQTQLYSEQNNQLNESST